MTIWLFGGLTLFLLLLALAAVLHTIVDDWKHRNDWKPPL